MRARRTLRPGQRGTKKLLRQYGSQLVCVRYRYDAERYLRFKTVEWKLVATISNKQLIVEIMVSFLISVRSTSQR